MIRLRGRCMHYFKKTLLAAAMAAFSLTVAFPAFADEPVGTDVTIVEAALLDTNAATLRPSDFILSLHLLKCFRLSPVYACG